MNKRKFARNSLWIMGGQIFRLCISFVISVITTRYLGPSNFGIINYIQSFVSFFTAIVGLGLNGVIIYELINNKNQDGKVLGTAITMRFIAGLISMFSLILIIMTTDSQNDVIIKVAILQSIQLPFLCIDTIQYWFQFQLQSKYPVIVQTLAYIITSIYKVYILMSNKSIEWFAFSLTLDIILVGLFYLIVYQKYKHNSFGISKSICKRLIKSSFPFILASIMTVVYGQMDKVMIRTILDNDALVGLYSVALTICTLISFIPNAIIETARPVVMEAKKNDKEIYQLRFKQMVAMVFWLCFLYSIFVMLFSKYILFILYGTEYLAANTCLKIAVWYTSFAFIGSAKSIWFICERKNKYVFLFSFFGVITNFGLNFIFIPKIGINGAAIATLITEFSVNFLYPLLFKDTREYSIGVFKAITLRGINVKTISNNLNNTIKKKFFGGI